MTIERQTTAIACGGAGFKSVFVQGVLSAFEANELRLAAYGGSSSAALPAALAAAGVINDAGPEIWTQARDLLTLPKNSMSDVSLAAISAAKPTLLARLFEPSAPRFCIATTTVH